MSPVPTGLECSNNRFQTFLPSFLQDVRTRRQNALSHQGWLPNVSYTSQGMTTALLKHSIDSDLLTCGHQACDKTVSTTGACGGCTRLNIECLGVHESRYVWMKVSLPVIPRFLGVRATLLRRNAHTIDINSIFLRMQLDSR